MALFFGRGRVVALFFTARTNVKKLSRDFKRITFALINMERSYRYFGNINETVRSIIKNNLNIEVDYDDKTGSSVVIVEESNANFKQFEAIANENNMVLIILYDFNIDDYKFSNYFSISRIWQNGYPMDDLMGGYMRTTYDLDSKCQLCGAGYFQKDLFYLKKEPNWGIKKQLFNLIWVEDEFFIKDSLYHEIFKDFGVKIKPVKLYKKNTIIESTYQIDIPVVDAQMALEKYEVCTKCGIKKFDFPEYSSGYLPQLNKEITLDIFKVDQWIVNGAYAFRPVIFSKKLYNEINKLGLKIKFRPMKLH